MSQEKNTKINSKDMQMLASKIEHFEKLRQQVGGLQKSGKDVPAEIISEQTTLEREIVDEIGQTATKLKQLEKIGLVNVEQIHQFNTDAKRWSYIKTGSISNDAVIKIDKNKIDAGQVEEEVIKKIAEIASQADVSMTDKLAQIDNLIAGFYHISGTEKGISQKVQKAYLEVTKPLISEVEKQIFSNGKYYFKNIDPKEFQEISAFSGGKKEKIPTLSACIENFNHLSEMVVADILQPKDVYASRLKLNRWLKIAIDLLNQGSAQDAQAVLSAINNGVLAPLKRNLAPNTRKALNALEELLSHEGASSNPRKLQELAAKEDQFFIPYVGITQTALTFIVDGNKAPAEETDEEKKRRTSFVEQAIEREIAPLVVLQEKIILEQGAKPQEIFSQEVEAGYNFNSEYNYIKVLTPKAENIKDHKIPDQTPGFSVITDAEVSAIESKAKKVRMYVNDKNMFVVNAAALKQLLTDTQNFLNNTIQESNKNSTPNISAFAKDLKKQKGYSSFLLLLEPDKKQELINYLNNSENKILAEFLINNTKTFETAKNDWLKVQLEAAQAAKSAQAAASFPPDFSDFEKADWEKYWAEFDKVLEKSVDKNQFNAHITTCKKLGIIKDEKDASVREHVNKMHNQISSALGDSDKLDADEYKDVFQNFSRKTIILTNPGYDDNWKIHWKYFNKAIEKLRQENPGSDLTAAQILKSHAYAIRHIGYSDEIVERLSKRFEEANEVADFNQNEEGYPQRFRQYFVASAKLPYLQEELLKKPSARIKDAQAFIQQQLIQDPKDTRAGALQNINEKLTAFDATYSQNDQASLIALGRQMLKNGNYKASMNAEYLVAKINAEHPESVDAETKNKAPVMGFVQLVPSTILALKEIQETSRVLGKTEEAEKLEEIIGLYKKIAESSNEYRRWLENINKKFDDFYTMKSAIPGVFRKESAKTKLTELRDAFDHYIAYEKTDAGYQAALSDLQTKFAALFNHTLEKAEKNLEDDKTDHLQKRLENLTLLINAAAMMGENVLSPNQLNQAAALLHTLKAEEGSELRAAKGALQKAINNTVNPALRQAAEDIQKIPSPAYEKVHNFLRTYLDGQTAASAFGLTDDKYAGLSAFDAIRKSYPEAIAVSVTDESWAEVIKNSNSSVQQFDTLEKATAAYGDYFNYNELVGAFNLGNALGYDLTTQKFYLEDKNNHKEFYGENDKEKWKSYLEARNIKDDDLMDFAKIRQACMFKAALGGASKSYSYVNGKMYGFEENRDQLLIRPVFEKLKTLQDSTGLNLNDQKIHWAAEIIGQYDYIQTLKKQRLPKVLCELEFGVAVSALLDKEDPGSIPSLYQEIKRLIQSNTDPDMKETCKELYDAVVQEEKEVQRVVDKALENLDIKQGKYKPTAVVASTPDNKLPNDFLNGKNYKLKEAKQGGRNDAGAAGGVYTFMENDQETTTKVLFKQDPHQAKNIAEYVAGQINTALLGDASAVIMLATPDGKIKENDDSEVYVGSVYHKNYQGDFYQYAYKTAGLEIPEDRPQFIGSINKGSVQEAIKKEPFASEFAPIAAASLLLGNFDLHSGNIGVTKKDGRERLVTFDFGGAFRDMDKEEIRPNSRRSHLPGLGPTNHFREYPREIRISEAMAKACEEIGENKEISGLIDKAMKDIEKYYSKESILAFAERAGMDVKAIENLDKPDMVQETTKFLQQKIQARQDSLKEFGIEIRIDLCIKYDEENKKYSINEAKLKDLIKANPKYFAQREEDGDFHLRASDHKDNEKMLSQMLHKAVKEISYDIAQEEIAAKKPAKIDAAKAYDNVGVELSKILSHPTVKAVEEKAFDDFGVKVARLVANDNDGIAVGTNGVTEVRFLTADAYNRVQHQDMIDRIEFLARTGLSVAGDDADKQDKINKIKDTYLALAQKIQVGTPDELRNMTVEKFEIISKEVQSLLDNMRSEIIHVNYSSVEKPMTDEEKVNAFLKAAKEQTKDEGRPNIVHVLTDTGLIHAQFTKGSETYPSTWRSDLTAANPNSVFDIVATNPKNPQVSAIGSRACAYSVLGEFGRDKRMQRFKANYDKAEADVTEIVKNMVGAQEIADSSNGYEITLQSTSLLTPYLGKKKAEVLVGALKLGGKEYVSETAQLKDHHRALEMLNGQTITVQDKNGKEIKVKLNIIHQNYPVNMKHKVLRPLLSDLQKSVNARGFGKYNAHQQETLREKFKDDATVLALLDNFKPSRLTLGEIQTHEAALSEAYHALRDNLIGNKFTLKEYQDQKKQIEEMEDKLGKIYQRADAEVAEKFKALTVKEAGVSQLDIAKTHISKLSQTTSDKRSLQQLLYYLDVQQQYHDKSYDDYKQVYGFLGRLTRSEDLAGGISAWNCKSSKDRSGILSDVRAVFIQAENDPELKGKLLLSDDPGSAKYLQENLEKNYGRSPNIEALRKNSPGGAGNLQGGAVNKNMGKIDKLAAKWGQIKSTKLHQAKELKQEKLPADESRRSRIKSLKELAKGMLRNSSIQKASVTDWNLSGVQNEILSKAIQESFLKLQKSEYIAPPLTEEQVSAINALFPEEAVMPSDFNVKYRAFVEIDIMGGSAMEAEFFAALVEHNMKKLSASAKNTAAVEDISGLKTPDEIAARQTELFKKHQELNDYHDKLKMIKDKYPEMYEQISQDVESEQKALVGQMGDLEDLLQNQEAGIQRELEKIQVAKQADKSEKIQTEMPEITIEPKNTSPKMLDELKALREQIFVFSGAEFTAQNFESEAKSIPKDQPYFIFDKDNNSLRGSMPPLAAIDKDDMGDKTDAKIKEAKDKYAATRQAFIKAMVDKAIEIYGAKSVDDLKFGGSKEMVDDALKYAKRQFDEMGKLSSKTQTKAVAQNPGDLKNNGPDNQIAQGKK